MNIHNLLLPYMYMHKLARFDNGTCTVHVHVYIRELFPFNCRLELQCVCYYVQFLLQFIQSYQEILQYICKMVKYSDAFLVFMYD